jgi:hypothetical protein
VWWHAIREFFGFTRHVKLFLLSIRQYGRDEDVHFKDRVLTGPHGPFNYPHF